MNNLMNRITLVASVFLGACLGASAVYAAAPTLASKPLYLDNYAPPLLLLTMQRDHRLFMEAYDDISDIDGDGVIDTRYSPSKLDYYGYFDSYKCYSYDSTAKNFVPQSVTSNKKCSGKWSGDFLNYLTTSRMDALRKVLYGGKRSTDSASKTVLERAYISRDFHCWGKDYDPGRDGYAISDYSPLASPSEGKRHLFVNATDDQDGANLTRPPLLRILTDREEHPWNWTSKEINVCTTELQKADATGEIKDLTPTDYVVRVEVCKEGLLETNCVAYGATPSYKPTGLLHDYGMKDAMKFGLLTGSFYKPTEGGVLRKNIQSFTDEVSTTDGTFTKPADSIVKTLDNIAIKKVTPTDDGGFPSWYGNPIAEMMYEGVRYFAGKTTPTSTFVNSGSSSDATLGLSVPSGWVSPYTSANWCAKPFQMVISDVIPTKDSNSLPGSFFNTGFSGDLAGLNVSTSAQAIWDSEFGSGVSKTLIIGESGDSTNQLPTGKTVNSFANIRGLVPEDPNKQGTYYAAAIAAWAKTNDVNPSISGDQKVDNFSVALSSPLPQIKVPVTVGGKTTYVTVVPYARTMGNPSIQAGLYRMFVEKVANISAETTDSAINDGRPYYRLRVIFGDQEYDGDFDMDAQVLYEVSLQANGSIKVYVSVHKLGYDKPPTDPSRTANATPDYAYAVTGALMHIGYSISGTTFDGTRLVIRNPQYNGGWTTQGKCLWTSAENIYDTAHSLDFWDGQSPRSSLNFTEDYYCGPDGKLMGPVNYIGSLPFYHSWSYTPSATGGASYVPHDPLWYAAKWGGFVDGYDNTTGRVNVNAKNNKLDAGEWEKIKSDNSLDTSLPRNYFPVTNASNLPATLSKAFEEVAQRDSSASAVAQNSSRLDTTTMIYQARFNPYFWSGELDAFKLDSSGVANVTPAWDAGEKIPEEPKRNKLFTWRESGKKGILFDYDADSSTNSLNATEMSYLGDTDDERLSTLLWLRGSRTGGSRNGVSATMTENNKKLRTRASTTVLGDIVNSDPLYVWGENFGYGDWTDLVGDSTLGALYTTFRQTKYGWPKMLFAGANDGMFHGFDAETGVEKFAYVPGIILTDSTKGLKSLASRGYVHRYFVDGPSYAGDAAIGNSTAPWKTILVGTLGAGGKGVFALDISNPDSFSASSVMWEFTHPELGNVIGQPLIARLNDGEWYAIIANGLDSRTCDSTGYNKNTCKGSTLDYQNAKLFLVKLKPSALSTSGWAEGSDYLVISATENITDAKDAKANGLTAVTGLDSNGDRKVDYVYSGDMQGNIWKFDLSDVSSTKWKVAYKSGNSPAPLFTASVSADTAQPITAPVELVQHPSIGGAYCVVAGTGRYLYSTDISDTSTQSLYGIIDSGSKGGLTRTDLQQQSILEEKEVSFGGGLNYKIRTTSSNSVGTKDGWYLDLLAGGITQQGEREVVTPVISGNKAIFTTIIPSNDMCVAGGSSWLMELSPCSGARLGFSPFDFNGDQSFNEKDYVTTSAGTKVPASGMQTNPPCTGSGCTSSAPKKLCQNPAIIKAGATEYKIFSCTDGSVQTVANKGNQPFPRSSWRQLR